MTTYSVQALLPATPLSAKDDELLDKAKAAGLYDPESQNIGKRVFPLPFSGASFVNDAQDTLYPPTLTLEELEAVSPKPQGFDLTPDQLDANVFAQFPAAYQVKYLKLNPAAGSTMTAAGPLIFATIGGGTTPGGAAVPGPVRALMSADDSKVYIIENLTKKDILNMPPADVSLLQKLAAGGDAFAAAINRQLSTLGLTVDPMIGISSDKQNALNAIGLYFEYRNTPELMIYNTRANLPAPPEGLKTYGDPNGYRDMPPEDRAVFAKEAQILANQILNDPLFSAKDAADALKQLTNRLTKVAAFAAQRKFTGFSTGTYTVGWLGDTVSFVPDPFSPFNPQISINTAINNTYNAMMAQEKRIAALSEQAYEQSAGIDLSGNPVTRPQNIDAPTLLFQFQLNANLLQEAEIAFETEMLKQLNALIQTYNNMQQMVNDTLKAFRTTNVDEAQGLQNSTEPPKLDGSNPDRVDLPEPVIGASNPRNLFASIASMFDKDSTANAFHPAHPLETLFAVTRPVQGMIDMRTEKYKTMTKTQWTNFNDQLSSVVTQLNQQVQILTDRVNSLTKQKDRHFDFGNNALGKMSDMIQSIGRNIS